MALALKARRSSDPSHRQANADLTPQELRLAQLMQQAANLLAQGADSAALRDAVRKANVAEAMDSLPWAQHDAQISEAVDTLSGALKDAGVNLEMKLPSAMTAGFTFNKADPRALAWAEAQAASLVREVSDNTRSALREIIADAFRKNLSVDEVARRIRATVGLTAKGAQTVTTLRERVTEQLIAGGTPPDKAAVQATAQAERMRTRLVKTRAKTIARTEVLRASNNGRYLGWTQAIESGFAPPNVMKQWSSTTASLSGGACPRCYPMHGEIVPWDGTFSNGINMPPAHPNCRCTALMVEPQPEQRKNPEDVTQETDRSTSAPLAVGVPTSPAPKPNTTVKKPAMPEIGIPKERRVGMGDIPIPSRALSKGSASAYLQPDGTFTPERQALHDKIVADALKGVRSVPTQSQPVFEMLGGGAGAGKSTVLNSGQVDVKSKTQAVHINADDLKEMLPEVQSKIANKETDWAAFGHEESSYLAKRILSASMEKRKNIVLDGTGDSGVDSVLSKINNARRAGYKVKATYVTVDTDEAVSRATKRAKATGRAVPTRIIRNTHQSVSKIFNDIAPEFDEITLVSTNGKAPVVVAKGVKGKALDILDNEEFKRFMAKATPDKPYIPPAPVVETPKAGATPVVATKRNSHIESQITEWQKNFPDEESLVRALRGMDYSQNADLIERPLIEKYMEQGMSGDDARTQVRGEMMRTRFYIQNKNQATQWEERIQTNSKYDPSFGKKMRTNAKLAVEQLADATKNGTITIAIESKSLKKVLKEGRFLNQFETNSSGGILDHDVRKMAEVGALNIPANASASERPIYGFLTNNAETVQWKNADAKRRWTNYLSINSDQVAQYGELRVTLKSDVRKRTTFTIGDSLRTGRLADNLDAENHDLTNAGFYDKAVSTQTEGEPTFGYLETQIFGGVSVKDIDTIYAPSIMVENVTKMVRTAGLDIPVVARED